MTIPGYIGIILAAMIVIIFLYRKTAIGTKYVKTIGEIITFKNMVPLVSKKGVVVGGNYVYSECMYQGDVFVTVKFISKDGEELTRRFNSQEPVRLKINEHKRIVPQYTTAFPAWKIGKRIKIYYDPANTLDLFVGKVPPRNSTK